MEGRSEGGVGYGGGTKGLRREKSIKEGAENTIITGWPSLQAKHRSYFEMTPKGYNAITNRSILVSVQLRGGPM